MSVPSHRIPDAGFTLVIEASSASGSVALLRGDALVERCAVAMGASRDDALFPAVQRVLAFADAMPTDLASIVCGSGPGSFTSLRIAAAVAKGLAHATGVPLFAVPSLLLAAASHTTAGQFVVHADALRGERYALPVTIDHDLFVHADGDVVRVSADALAVLVATRHQLVVLGSVNSEQETPVVPDAAQLGRVHQWRRYGRVALDRWEPAYGRLAEAQVKWELTHQQSLPSHG
ncbi:MAG: tRNA (adenosine(37)-N6)-threonylcarbamoyltransferase complex dimerization subunit type 1 TsaB [Gemmatimonadaceae bacterium]|nr:tRNA (adenosine(37)-N6)-threonylcarbamoyltransferase complex dimerization subunit type 1 TsaB [Gemmatimonadaceae bacterium]